MGLKAEAGKRSKKNPARAKACTEWSRAKVKYQHGIGGKEAPDGRKRNPAQPENGLRRILRNGRKSSPKRAEKKPFAAGIRSKKNPTPEWNCAEVKYKHGTSGKEAPNG